MFRKFVPLTVWDRRIFIFRMSLRTEALYVASDREDAKINRAYARKVQTARSLREMENLAFQAARDE